MKYITKHPFSINHPAVETSRIYGSMARNSPAMLNIEVSLKDGTSKLFSGIDSEYVFDRTEDFLDKLNNAPSNQ